MFVHNDQVWLQLDRLVEEEAGFVVDLRSPKDVRKALFEKLKIPVPNSRTTQKGNIKVDAEVSTIHSHHLLASPRIIMR